MGEFGLSFASGLSRGMAQGQQIAQQRELEKQELKIRQQTIKLQEQTAQIQMQKFLAELGKGVALGKGQRLVNPFTGQQLAGGETELGEIEFQAEQKAIPFNLAQPEERQAFVQRGLEVGALTPQQALTDIKALSEREPVAPEARMFQESIQRHKAAGKNDEQAFTAAKDELAEFRAKSAGLTTAAKREETPITGEAAGKLSELNNLIRIIDEDVVANFKPEYVGPVAGRVGAAKRFAGMVGSQEAVFRSAVADIQDMLLRARSGAQINEQEYQRLLKIAPNINFGVEDFLASLGRFKKVVEGLRAEKLKLATTPKKELGKQKLQAPTQAKKATDKLRFNPQTGEVE